MNIFQNIKSLYVNRVFVLEMAKRDLVAVNKGAVLGYLWHFVSPLVQTTVYVVIVSFVFKQRFAQGGGILDYALYVLSGQIPWQIVTKSLQAAPMLIRERIDIVKQVIYPIESLPLTTFITSTFGSLVSFIIFVLLSAYAGNFHLSVLLLPVPIILLVFLVLGFSWIFMIAGVLLKDLRDVITVILGLLVYLSPVILTPEMVGGTTWKLILYNPLAHVVIAFRDVFYGTFHGESWLIFTGVSVLSLLLGAASVTKMRIAINEFI